MNTKNNKTTKTIGKNNNMNATKKGAFSYSIYNKENFESFKKLKVDTTAKSIDRKDLPQELSDETCEFIELFRRKTENESIEWNFYIDYEKNEIIHCILGSSNQSLGWINTEEMKNRKILSIHNHPKNTYSAPSAANFEILEYEFEDYEIICSQEEFWILKAIRKYEIREKIHKDISIIFESIKNSNSKNKNNIYSEIVINYINNLNQKIVLTRKEYR